MSTPTTLLRSLTTFDGSRPRIARCPQSNGHFPLTRKADEDRTASVGSPLAKSQGSPRRWARLPGRCSGLAVRGSRRFLNHLKTFRTFQGRHPPLKGGNQSSQVRNLSAEPENLTLTHQPTYTTRLQLQACVWPGGAAALGKGRPNPRRGPSRRPKQRPKITEGKSKVQPSGSKGGRGQVGPNPEGSPNATSRASPNRAPNHQWNQLPPEALEPFKSHDITYSHAGSGSVHNSMLYDTLD